MDPYERFLDTFDEMTRRLTWALFRFRSREEPDLKFENLLELSVSERLRQFRDRLKQFDDGIPLDSRELISRNLKALHKAAADMETVCRWRDYPLSLTSEDCDRSRKLAITVIVTLPTFMNGLFGLEDTEKALKAVMAAPD